MNLTLPKRIDGNTPITLHNVKQITVIGANGAGKTRFSRKILEDCAGRAFKMSALKAIFPSMTKNNLEGSIDNLFELAGNNSHFIKSDAQSEFDKLMFLLLHDEFIELLKYKADLLGNVEGAKVPVTRLDRVAKRWEEIFPKNKILRAGGKLLFSSDSGDDSYSSMTLSDGEKAILYYLGAVLYAMPDAVIFVDDPGVFLHHSVMQALWNVIEQMRPDCTFIYNTHDLEFAGSRLDNKCIWVKNFDAINIAWDYEIVGSGEKFSEELYFDLLGSRKPVLFIEGDEMHSIDSKLYPLVFTEYTVKPLGSCNKVIESTRSFNDLENFHHLDSHGIVDRDRRDDKEVQYLRDKKIFVPNVAEIENILMLPDLITTVARRRGKKQDYVLNKVRKAVIDMFDSELRQQALMHVRHRVKRNVEYRIDRRFQNINALEDHMVDLVNEINPRGMYEDLCRTFHILVDNGNYLEILKVYNQKSMVPDSNVAQLCGLTNKDEYIHYLLNILKEDKNDAAIIRRAIKRCFSIENESINDKN
ncbi:MAG: DUF4435 domain-containing protein [Muribaculaceae bacterium]|nr:DUF4435 domain-containing protein [Muribaculaceae bacterium]